MATYAKISFLEGELALGSAPNSILNFCKILSRSLRLLSKIYYAINQTEIQSIAKILWPVLSENFPLAVTIQISKHSPILAQKRKIDWTKTSHKPKVEAVWCQFLT